MNSQRLRHPSLFAGNPFPLRNCTTHNHSGAWIRISCIEGLDGGLPQKFVAAVNEQRWESDTPYWEIEIHKPTAVSLYAVNAKGSSDPVVLDVVAFKDVAKFTGKPIIKTTYTIAILPVVVKVTFSYFVRLCYDFRLCCCFIRYYTLAI